MKTIRWVTALVVTFTAFTAAGCGSLDKSTGGGSTTNEDAPAGAKKSGSSASGTPVEGAPLVVDLPAGAVANEGVPGFHSADESVYVMIRSATPTDPLEFDAAKEAAEQILFKKWIKSEKTADGWALTYVGMGMDMDGKEYDSYNFDVRRKIGSVNYECYGAVKKQADVEKNLKLCQSIKAAG